MLGDTVTLNNGVQMPRLGLGVWQSAQGEETVNAVKAAIQAGYRHIDTAAMYENEESVGQGIRESGVPRDEIFVTTKLATKDQGYDSAMRAFEASMKRLGLETLDQYLIHWPRNAEERGNSWRAFEELNKAGRIRSIGVSNYMPKHLTELLENSEIVPAANQFELTAYNYTSRNDVVSMCRANKIAIIAYSPIARAHKMDDPHLVALAEKYGRTPAQILLRYLVQQDAIVIPKSVNPKRIAENGAIFDFEISDDDMVKLTGFNEGLIFAPDPYPIP